MSYQINASQIIIAGGTRYGIDKKNCFVFDTVNQTLENSSDLPFGATFISPSPFIYKDELWVVSKTKSKHLVYKYQIKTDKWKVAFNM